MTDIIAEVLPEIDPVLPTTDYHTHTTFSLDARNTPQEMCKTAVERGMTAIAFTEHAEWHNNQRGFFRGKDSDLTNYFHAIDDCRQQYGDTLTIYSGVELGNPHTYHTQANNLLQSHPFDLKLGSVHWLYGHNIHDSIVYRQKPTIEEVLSDYFTEIRQMVSAYDIDIVAHFDRIFWRATILNLSYDLAQVESTIRETFRTIIKNNRILELNSKCTAPMGIQWNDTLLTLLSWYKEEGGDNITISSDAHNKGHIQRNFETAIAIFEQAGFSTPLAL